LEDLAEKSSGSISTSSSIGQVVGAIDKLNRDPEGTAIILAAISADTVVLTGCNWGSSR
jgi:Kef-type K+ transport system membrane component KefB